MLLTTQQLHHIPKRESKVKVDAPSLGALRRHQDRGCRMENGHCSPACSLVYIP